MKHCIHTHTHARMHTLTYPHTHTHTHTHTRPLIHRVKLAVHKETGECVAVKIMNVNGKEGLTDECLRKEVVTEMMEEALLYGIMSALIHHRFSGYIPVQFNAGLN